MQMPVKPSRRTFLKVAGVTTGAAVLTGMGTTGCSKAPAVLSARNQDPRPNVVMITVDTTRYDRVGFNGYARNTSPNLDRCAESGWVFERNYAQAPVTIPSVSSLLTSAYPMALGTNQLVCKLPGTRQTLATLLRDRGYLTFGATSVYFLDRTRGFDQGFDHFSSPEENPPGRNDFYRHLRSAGDSVRSMANMVHANLHVDAPQFFWLHLYDPHVPYMAPDEFTFKFENTADPPVPTKERHLFGLLRAPDGSESGRRSGYGLRPEAELIRHSAEYDGQILYADRQVGYFLQHLQELGLFDLERDLLVVTSDHGELLGEHGYFASHHGGYDEVAHVPLLFAGSGLQKGRSIDALTANLDVLPTILDIVDSKLSERHDPIEPISEWEGKSLLSLPSGSKANNGFVLTELPDLEGYAVHTGEYTLVKRCGNDGEITLSAPVDGFSPSGVALDYDPGNPNNVIRFTWPDGLTPADHSENVTVHFRLSAIMGGKTFQLTEERIPFSGPRYDLDAWWLWGEDKWNKRSTHDKLFWEIRVVSTANGNEEVLFDSADTRLEFKLNPTPNAAQLFDDRLRGVEREENRWDNPVYKDTRTKLENDVQKYVEIAEKGFLDDASKYRKPTQEEVQRLDALGYAAG